MKNSETLYAIRAVIVCLAVVALAPQITVAQRPTVALRPYAPMEIEEVRKLEASAVKAINEFRNKDNQITHLDQAQDAQQLLVTRKDTLGNFTLEISFGPLLNVEFR